MDNWRYCDCRWTIGDIATVHLSYLAPLSMCHDSHEYAYMNINVSWLTWVCICPDSHAHVLVMVEEWLSCLSICHVWYIEWSLLSVTVVMSHYAFVMYYVSTSLSNRDKSPCQNSRYLSKETPQVVCFFAPKIWCFFARFFGHWHPIFPIIFTIFRIFFPHVSPSSVAFFLSFLQFLKSFCSRFLTFCSIFFCHFQNLKPFFPPSYCYVYFGRLFLILGGAFLWSFYFYAHTLSLFIFGNLFFPQIFFSIFILQFFFNFFQFFVPHCLPMPFPCDLLPILSPNLRAHSGWAFARSGLNPSQA